ncbi:hypothetical protein MMC12_007839 [Toensbergia leucococca]|nr:hypothetical protein [Toensbergia leucococca]
MTAVIANTGLQHVAVLKHNTIFVTSHPSMPCEITDESGIQLPGGRSYAMYSRVGNDDQLNLPLGSNFTRHFNISKYINLEEEDARSQKPVVISLPSTVLGLVTHDGSYQIHPDALGGIFGTEVRMGDISKSTLADILIRSEPLRFTLSGITSRPHIDKCQQLFSGIKVQTDSSSQCSGAQLSGLTNTVLYASYLAVAAQNAALQNQTLPFNYFFEASGDAASAVNTAMGKVVTA